MKTIDIAHILSPDLKLRMRAKDLEEYMDNTNEKEFEIDFSNVQFATRSFIDEFYNLFLKEPDTMKYHVEITNIPEDINALFESVSRTQTRSKVIPAKTPVRNFNNVDDLLKYLNAAF